MSNAAHPATFELREMADAVHAEVIQKGDYGVSIILVEHGNPNRELGEVFIALEGGELRVQLYDEEHVGSGNGEEFVLADMAFPFKPEDDEPELDPDEGSEYGDVTSPPADLHG